MKLNKINTILKSFTRNITTKYYKMMCNITFPEPKDISINMMPIIMDDITSIPKIYQHYYPLIEKCMIDKEQKGNVVYLTIKETFCEKGKHKEDVAYILMHMQVHHGELVGVVVIMLMK
jgi:hypothetical protein